MSKTSVILILKKRFLLLTAAILLTILFIISGNKTIPANKILSNQHAQIPLAGNGMEPEIPRDLDDPPFYNPPMPSIVVPINEVIAKGQEIPLDFIYNDPNWKRKAYKAYWHSKYRRWSYVPIRLHYAMHRLFTTYPTASVYYDFVHDLGIAEENMKFKGYLPAPPKDKFEKVNPYQKIRTVVMQTDVNKIITYGNQVVLIGKPGRTGLQAFDIPVNRLRPFNADENMLIQLATSMGDEIDYSLINLPKFSADQ